MSDNDDNLDGTGDDNAPKTLRAQNSKLAADKAALEQQVKDLLARDRSRTIAEVLRDKGANPKIAKYAERELPEGSLDETAVEKWLTDEGELFGYKPQAADAGDAGDEDEDDPLVVQQQQRISAATASAPPASTGWTPEKLRQSSHAQLVEAGILDRK